jgi:hypothetical protein
MSTRIRLLGAGRSARGAGDMLSSSLVSETFIENFSFSSSKIENI